MKQNSRPFLSYMFFWLLMVAASIAQAEVPESYGSQVSHKALNGFTNMATSVLEIPKNIINTTNQSNIAYGTVGGMVKGILNTVGRMMSGLADFVTAPLPTKQFVYPAYVWDDFDEDTTYGEVFRIPETTQ